VLAQVRAQTYRKYAWPEGFGRAFERNGTVVSLVTALSLALFLVFTGWLASPARFFAPWSDAEGSFYAVLPHGVMASIFLLVSVYVAIALLASFVRFWPDMGEDTLEFVKAPQLSGATWDAMGLKYLDGGGDGCTYPDAAPSFARRTFHHLTFYGFLLCFAATTVATAYHYIFGWKAPYPLYSLPVLLGVFGGAGLIAGPAGLIWLRNRRDPELADESQDAMDSGFMWLLLGTSATGLLLLFLRETRVMGVLLATHLGIVLALFLTLPYGKFVHALYRFAALVRFHIEHRRSLPFSSSE
jgi:citrate/tricarballylate utilization protein